MRRGFEKPSWISHGIWHRVSFCYASETPFYFNKLQGEFFTMRKSPKENMLAYASKFERLAHKLGLHDSSTLVPQFLASLPSSLATQLQLFVLSSTSPISLSAIIQTAVSLDNSRSVSKSNAGPPASFPPHALSSEAPKPASSASTSTILPSSKSRSREYCTYHGYKGHSTANCRLISAVVIETSSAPNPPASTASPSRNQHDT